MFWLIYLIGLPITLGLFWACSDQKSDDVGACLFLAAVWPASLLMALGMIVGGLKHHDH